MTFKIKKYVNVKIQGYVVLVQGTFGLNSLAKPAK